MNVILEYDQEKKKLLEEIFRLKIENNQLKSDFTPSKVINKYLFESEQKFEQLFNNISDAVYYLKIDEDGFAGEFLEVNKVAYRRLGYTREEILKMSPFEIDIHETGELIEILKKIKNNETITFETVHICKNGSLIPVEIKTHVLNIEKQKYILAVCRDISDRKQAETVKIKAEKLKIVAQLAAGLAHEIKNPLTSLKGFVKLFRSDTDPNKEFLDIMESELERINSISSEFLTLAKPYHNHFASVDLQKILKNVAALLETEATRRKVAIHTKFPSENIIVKGAESELKKVFLNLFKNAIEAMPNGGNINLIIKKKDDVVVISIQDDGVGMTDDQVRRLGEPFFTTKETGTGLGLMVSFKIINAHHGEICVKSKPNEGTVFTVKLPCS